LKTKIKRLVVVVVLALLIAMPILLDAGDANAQSIPEEAFFEITAYYSPLPGQRAYVTGSYDEDRRLNGNGTHGASGKAVFPGMIAAPSTYAFGTKIQIDGFGVGEVADRGGGIKSAGEENRYGTGNYDRLDLWMGYGDEGMARALAFGRRVVGGSIVSVDSEVSVNFDVDMSQFTSQIAYTTTSPIQQQFDENLIIKSNTGVGASGDRVEDLQRYMRQLGYYYGEYDGDYTQDLESAVLAFQLDHNVVSSADSRGAGYAGPMTRSALTDAIESADEATVVEREKIEQGHQLASKYDDLYENPARLIRDLGLGDTGDDVRLLQEQLIQLGYMRTDVTGVFGEVTENAVLHMQLKTGIIESREDDAAGYAGPSTRAFLNNLMTKRMNSKSSMAYNRNQNTQVASSE